MCLEKYELDSICFVSAPGLAWQACLKTTGVDLELLTFVALRPKTYSYLDDNGNEHKKVKGTKKKMHNKTKNHVSKFQRLFIQ